MLTTLVTGLPPSAVPPGATLVLSVGPELVAAVALAGLTLSAGLLLEHALLERRPGRRAGRVLPFPTGAGTRRAA